MDCSAASTAILRRSGTWSCEAASSFARRARGHVLRRNYPLPAAEMLTIATGVLRLDGRNRRRSKRDQPWDGDLGTILQQVDIVNNLG
jgi:hypothetical protein